MTTITTIDPASLEGAAESPWALLKNATVSFIKVLATETDPLTGNPEPSLVEQLDCPCYFKSANLVTDEGRGVPIGTYPVSGYTVGILPGWAKESSFSPALECHWENLGAGIFTWQGKGHVVKSEVEEAGQGSQLQGYFTLRASR